MNLKFFYGNCPKILYNIFPDKMTCANSADPDQTVPSGAVWLGYTLFAIPSCFLFLLSPSFFFFLMWNTNIKINLCKIKYEKVLNNLGHLLYYTVTAKLPFLTVATDQHLTMVLLKLNLPMTYSNCPKIWTLYSKYFYSKFCFLWSCFLKYRIKPNNRTVHLGFSKLLGTLICGKICIYLLRVHLKKKIRKGLLWWWLP